MLHWGWFVLLLQTLGLGLGLALERPGLGLGLGLDTNALLTSLVLVVLANQSRYLLFTEWRANSGYRL